MNNVSSPHLNVCLTNWRHVTKMPKFTASAFHICDFTADTFTEFLTPYEKLEAIVFIGSFQGEVIRWLVHEEGATPYSTSYGHFYNTKIVQFAECTFPLVRNAIVSLSYDGSICVWSVLDGICLRHFSQILPKGCQRIACSNTAIEIAAVSGSFPNICIVDIQRGYIIQEIRPIPKFAVSLKFYSEGDSEWLFALGSNGCASFTTLTPKTAASYRFGIFSSKDNDVLIGAYPSPHFSFVICIYAKGYSIVALFSKSFQSYVNEKYPNIQTAIWLTEYSFALVKYDGSFEIYSLEKPDEKALTPASAFKNIKYTTAISIRSILEEKSSADILDYKMNIATLINPFQTLPYTKEKIEQTPLNTIQEYNQRLADTLEITEDFLQILDKPTEDKNKSKDKNKDKGKDKDSKKRSDSTKNKNKSKKSDDSKKGDNKKQAESENETTESQSPSAEIENQSINPEQEDIKYNIDPKFILSGESNIPLPLVSSFSNDMAFAFDDYIIFAKKNYQEYALSIITDDIDNEQDENNLDADKKGEDKEVEVTAQSYYIKDNKIQALIEGNAIGKVVIQYMNGRKEKLGQIHKGRIIAMCTAGTLLFTSGKDCVLNVYSIEEKRTLKFYSNFVSPVTKFYFPCKKTRTSIDNCVFCATSDGIISVIDISAEGTNNLFILTSHESQIEKIYFHPPTKLLLVQCRSLYFWSMITGNLESIMNGQQMFKYLNEMKDILYEITDEKGQDTTPKPCITRFGNYNLRATEIDICEFAYKIGERLDSHKTDTVKTAIKSIYNLPFLNNLLPTKTSNLIKKECEKKLHKRMNIGFSGHDGILTANLEQLGKKTEWLYSPQVTALLLSVRIALAYALKHHPFFSNSNTWKEIFKNDTNYKFFSKKKPDLSYLIKITLNLDANVHKFIFHILKKYDPKVRNEWLKKIVIIYKNKIFKNYQKFFHLLYIIIKATFFNDLQTSNDAAASEFALYLYNYQNNPRNYKTYIARELIGFHISSSNEKNFKTILSYYTEENRKELFVNLFKYSKFILSSSAIDYFINDNYCNYLNGCSLYVRNNSRKNPNDCLRIIGNLAHVLKYNKRCKFTDRCSTILCNSASYFSAAFAKNYFDVRNSVDNLTKLASNLHELSGACHYFGYDSCSTATYLAFGTNDGYLYIYKLKRNLNDISTKKQNYNDLFDDDSDIGDDENQSGLTIISGSGTGTKMIPNSRSYTLTAQSSANSPSSGPSSTSFPRSKSLSTSATPNLSSGNNDASNENSGALGSSKATAMTSENEPSESASQSNNNASASSAALSTDSIVFGSIQLDSKSGIHSVTVWAERGSVFAAAGKTIYRVNVTGESTSSSAAASSDESSLKPRLKLATSEKVVEDVGTFEWESGQLHYIFPKSGSYEVNLSSDKL